MDSRLIPQESFDSVVDLRPVELVTLTNSLGTTVQITNFGARVVSFFVKDASGYYRDIVIGHESIDSYTDSKERYFNAVIGRYANRIAGGQFSINGKEYKTTINSGSNTLHGGVQGLNELVWEIITVKKNKVRMECTLEDGEDGFPGKLNIAVRYLLNDDNELVVEYFAKSDEDTVINITNHMFFNLGASHENNILNHKLLIDACQYTPIDENMIPTGEILPVEGTVFDFTEFKEIGKDINSDALKATLGYDHNFVLNNYPSRNGAPVFAASVIAPDTGLRMDISTTEPGLQLYTGNFLNGSDKGKCGVVYKEYGAFCLETQHFPDSPNKEDFPSTVLEAGEDFYSSTIYKITAEEKK